MSDDLELAALLGEAPDIPDPTFRYDVFAHLAERARRRHARGRAARTVGGFTLVGAVFPMAQAVGLGFHEIQPFLVAGGVLAVAGLAALLTIRGPSVVLAYSRAWTR